MSNHDLLWLFYLELRKMKFYRETLFFFWLIMQIP